MKDSGGPLAILQSISDQIINTRFRTSSTERERAKIIDDLDPYPHLTLDQVAALVQVGAVDQIELRVKAGLPAYIRRFETENKPITEFGIQRSYAEKIAQIQSKIKDYATERE